MATNICPHCNNEFQENSQFCQICGKAVQAFSSGPQITDENTEIAQTAAGKNVQSKTLEQAINSAKRCLFTVGVLQFIGAILLFVIMRTLGVKSEDNEAIQLNMNITIAAVVGIGIIYFVLGFWAKRSPLPATLVGLILFISLYVLDGLADPSRIMSGIIIKIIILLVLIKGVKAGLQYRKLKSSMLSPLPVD